MRFLFFIILICGQGACTNIASTTPKQLNKETNAALDGLSTQNLALGECGMFLWSLSSPPVFKYFQKNNTKEAKLYLNEEQNIHSSVPIFILQQSLKFQFDYHTISGKAIVVKGKYGDEMQGGRRIPSGSIQMETPDGWQEIIPISGVYACR